MAAYIDLDRRFRDLTQEELEDPELLASLNDHAYGGDIGWTEVLAQSRVLLLAEAGSGKTREMRQQAQALTDQGKLALFVALEALGSEALDGLLSNAEAERLQAWRGGDAPGWFFLDAVDELKLTDGKLDTAFRRLAKALEGNLDRARIVVSCRPIDWRPDHDLTLYEYHLPPPTSKRERPLADALFLKVIGNIDDETVETEINQTTSAPAVIRPLVLLPMSQRQIRRFAIASGVADADRFLAEIDRQDAWTFARRPLDLTELVQTWSALGELGTLAQQHEANVVAKLKEDPDRPDKALLSDAIARDGAERLALAMALSRARTLRSPDQVLIGQHATGVLDPAQILTDWTPGQRQALLRRALFDPATYGRVRFHHRSVQEYLAACHLRALRAAGMSTKAMARLLFGERYGIKIVLPSMSPITAWLALWDEPVRGELIRREPEALLSQGDPGSLEMAWRVGLVRAFARAYGQGGWRGLNIPLSEVRRLAHPDLADVVRELWGKGPDNPDLREFLLELMWVGAMKACADLAFDGAMDARSDAHDKVCAVRALVVTGHLDAARRAVDDMFAHPQAWPAEAVHGLAGDLFPAVIDAARLVALIAQTPDDKGAIGFGWHIGQLAETLPAGDSNLWALIQALAELIWTTRAPEQAFYRITSAFDTMTGGLATLCLHWLQTDRQAPDGALDVALLRACVIASRFGDRANGGRESVTRLRDGFAARPELRQAGFWAELELMDILVPDADDWRRWHHVDRESLVGLLKIEDRGWLVETLADRKAGARRSVALEAALSLTWAAGDVAEQVQALRDAVCDDEGLSHRLATALAPQPVDPKVEAHAIQAKAEVEARAKAAAKIKQDWIDWKAKLMADPQAAFGPDRYRATVSTLLVWLNMTPSARSKYDVWSRQALSEGFDADIADRAALALRAYWREQSPLLWSQRPPGERHGYPRTWVNGLCGVAAETEQPGWAAALSDGEARKATAYATLELNGLAPFIVDLVQAHPRVVDAVLGAELSAQLQHQDANHRPLLQDVRLSDLAVRRLMAPRVLAALIDWPTKVDPEITGSMAILLENCLWILQSAGDAPTKARVVEIGLERYHADPLSPLALTWLDGVRYLEPEAAADALIATLMENQDAPATQDFALAAFAALFGERPARGVDIDDEDRRARVLAKLARAAHAFVRVENDNVHKGSYSPDVRDRAEMGRNHLLSALLSTPGSVAHEAILALAAEPEFKHLPDRLLLMARQRAAKEAEFTAYAPADILALERHKELPPHDRDGLFAVMVDRLDDLAHTLAHHDFTDRATLRTIGDEVEMQRTLALRLDGAAREAFVVTREDEVADAKRTDIRLSAVRGGQKAVIEIKLADTRWSLSDLIRALEHQLVGQYLRHAACKAGCLLLTYDGAKRYWRHPATGRHLRFAAMVAYLNELSAELEFRSGGAIRLAVVGLDLTDPPLVAAHRKT